MPQSFIKFYGNDWRSDPRLRMCQAESRGVWIDLISIMMEAEPFGHLLVNGAAPSAEIIGALTVTPAKVVKRALLDLEANGVFSRTGAGIIYSRRMTKDAVRAAEASERGKRGGNPALVKREDNQRDKPEVKQLDNPEVKSEVKLAGATRSQKPEARIPQTPNAGSAYVPIGAVAWSDKGPSSTDPDGVHVAWTFHKCRETHFGNSPPPFLRPDEISICQGWVDRGVGYERCRELMDERMRRMSEKGDSPPGSIKFFDRAIGEIAGRAA